MALLDTNILVYADQKQAEYHHASKRLRDQGVGGEIPVCISPQILGEFFAILTSPRRVTHPLTPREAMSEIRKYVRTRRIRKIYPGPRHFKHVQTLFAQHPSVKGQGIFDLLLVVTMLENGITRIYTYNTSDFTPFSNAIEVLLPPPPAETPTAMPSR